MRYVVTDKGVLEIAEHEGLVLGPYYDSKNILTYGVGHTKAAGGLDPAKLPRVDTRTWDSNRVRQEMLSILKLFDEDLDKYEARVNHAVKVPLKPHQFDALVSFDFNTGGIYSANLTRELNAGDIDGAARGFMGWLKPKEIIGRRTAEMNLFMTGDYEANGSRIPIYDALPDGSYRHRGVMDSVKLATLMSMASAKHKVQIKPPSIGWDWLRRIFANLKHQPQPRR